MTVTPPTIGQEDWGDDLNAYLVDLEERIADNVARIAALESDVSDLQSEPAPPEHVFNSYAWSYNSGAPPATAGQVRLDTTDPMTAMVMDFRKIDVDGADRTPIFQQLSDGSMIRINDWDDASILHRFEVTGEPTIDATNVQVPVVWSSGSGTLPSGGQAAKVNVAFLVTLIV
jgi:hypothetical protein